MHLNAAKVLQLLAASTLIEPFVVARATLGGDLEVINRPCEFETCKDGQILPELPRSIAVDLGTRAPPVIRPGGAGKPGGGKPGSGEPGSGAPGSSKPGSSKPGSSKPGSSKPGSGAPGGRPDESNGPGQPGSDAPAENRPSPGTSDENPRPGDSSRQQPGPFEDRIPPPDAKALKFEEYGEKGKRVRDVLEEAISTHKPDVTKPPIDRFYKIERSKNQMAALEPAKLAETIGGAKDDKSFTHIQVTNNKDLFIHPVSDTVPIHEALYSPKLKAIQIKESYSRRDYLPDGTRATYSELTFQNWKSVAGDNVKDLKWVVQDTILNEGTWNTIAAARQAIKVTEGEAVFVPSKPGSAMDNAFNSLSGTENVRGTWFMLADHHTELGGLKVVGIRTYDSPFYLLIEIGH
ncbi:hypothetical protein McanMca71_007223 [Microsporum canis]